MQAEGSENYNRFKEIVKKKKTKILIVGNKNLNRLSIENNVYFDFIWPNKENIIQDNCLNNNSIVCKLYYNNFSILFTGDIEEQAEYEILNTYKKNILKSTILKVAHHGSTTSSTKEFIEAVNPKVALIGVGKNNKFGHPNEDVIERLKSCNTKIYRTDQMGEIELKINKRLKIVAQYR